MANEIKGDTEVLVPKETEEGSDDEVVVASLDEVTEEDIKNLDKEEPETMGGHCSFQISSRVLERGN